MHCVSPSSLSFSPFLSSTHSIPLFLFRLQIVKQFIPFHRPAHHLRRAQRNKGKERKVRKGKEKKRKKEWKREKRGRERVIISK